MSYLETLVDALIVGGAIAALLFAGAVVVAVVAWGFGF